MMQPRNLALAIGAPLCWGTGFTLAKPAVAHFPPLFLMLMVYAAIAVMMLVTYRGMPRTPWPKLLLISATAVTIQGAFLFSAMRYLEATTANLIIQIQVPAAIFLGWLLAGDQLDARKLAGTVIALVGVAIVIGLPTQRPPLLPVLSIMAAGIIWALGQVLTRKWSVDTGMMMLKSNAMFGVPQLFAATFLLERGQWQALATAGPLQWFYLAFVAVVGFYLAYVCWLTLLQHVSIDLAAPFVLLMTPICVITAVLWLGERLQAAQVVGGLILLFGLAIASGLFARRAGVKAA
ncbi:MAG: EamA family transporter [Proteobacteria bacterium]|nr:EamA family transporter [Pseudomonadota bacterium]